MKETDPRIDIRPCRWIEGSVRVPGDKSISHRALLVAALADGPVRIDNLSPAADVWSTEKAVAALGVHVAGSEALLETKSTRFRGLDTQLLVERSGDGLRMPTTTINAGNSGSTMRMMLGVLAGSSVEATLTGDTSLSGRPMGRVVGPLRDMGAQIESADGGATAPLTVRGTPLHGFDHDLDIASAQVKSAILFAGLSAEGHTSVTEPHRSRDHTERLLRHLGVPIEQHLGRLIVKSTKPRGDTISIPGDLSSAAFLLVAAAINGSSVLEIPDVGVNPTRTGILDILAAFGAEVSITATREVSGEPRGTVSLRAAERKAFEVADELTVEAIDELPLVAVLGCFAEGETIVRGAAELRLKESDRIEAICQGLRAMGANIQSLPDGFAVHGPTRLHGALVDAAGDHRIAMALAVAALAADSPTTISGWDCVAVSYPGFEHDLASVVVP